MASIDNQKYKVTGNMMFISIFLMALFVINILFLFFASFVTNDLLFLFLMTKKNIETNDMPFDCLSISPH